MARLKKFQDTHATKEEKKQKIILMTSMALQAFAWLIGTITWTYWFIYDVTKSNPSFITFVFAALSVGNFYMFTKAIEKSSVLFHSYRSGTHLQTSKEFVSFVLDYKRLSVLIPKKNGSILVARMKDIESEKQIIALLELDEEDLK